MGVGSQKNLSLSVPTLNGCVNACSLVRLRQAAALERPAGLRSRIITQATYTVTLVAPDGSKKEIKCADDEFILDAAEVCSSCRNELANFPESFLAGGWHGFAVLVPLRRLLHLRWRRNGSN